MSYPDHLEDAFLRDLLKSVPSQGQIWIVLKGRGVGVIFGIWRFQFDERFELVRYFLNWRSCYFYVLLRVGFRSDWRKFFAASRVNFYFFAESRVWIWLTSFVCPGLGWFLIFYFESVWVRLSTIFLLRIGSTSAV